MIFWWTLPVAGVLGLFVGIAASSLLASRRRRLPAIRGDRAATDAAEPGSATPVRAPAPRDPDLDQLLNSVIEARDLAESSSVLARRLGTALAKAGLREYRPLGEPYDPMKHYAVGTESAPDPSSVDVIAEVQRVGYLRDDEVIRPADVVVFRLEPVT